MSPELFETEIEGHHRTKRSDCYALGMVIYEVLSGHIPFYRYENRVIILKVTRGVRPEKPQGVEGVWFPNDVWEVLERCWTPQPVDRPGVEDVLQCLERVSRSWIPSSPRPVAVPSPADSSTWTFSDIITEGVDEVGVPQPSGVAPSRSSEGSDPEKSAGIIKTVCRISFLSESQ